MNWKEDIEIWKRFLTFRSKEEDLYGTRWSLLILAVLGTWIAGIGRWVTDPDASLIQRTGIGSVAYILLLSMALYVVLWFVSTKKTRFFDVLAMVGMTAPPALVYAIPVERWFVAEVSAGLHGAALAFVSIYRVSLLIFFVVRCQRYNVPGAMFGILFLLSSIIVYLFTSGKTGITFTGMGGIERADAAIAQDVANAINSVACVGLLVAPLAGLCYLTFVFQNWPPGAHPEHRKR
jgi:hypothetical protein